MFLLTLRHVWGAAIKTNYSQLLDDVFEVFGDLDGQFSGWS